LYALLTDSSLCCSPGHMVSDQTVRNYMQW
jgi:hypothetical protein